MTQKESFLTITEKIQTLQILHKSNRPFNRIFVKRPDGTGIMPFCSFGTTLPEGLEKARDTDKFSEVQMFVVHNLTTNCLQAWGVTQKSIKEALGKLASDAAKDGRNISELIIAVSKQGSGMETTYTVAPLTDKKGKHEYQMPEQIVIDYFHKAIACGDIDMSKMLTNEYPMQGMALEPIVDIATLDISFSGMKAATDFATANIIATELLKIVPFVEGDDEVTKEDVNKLLAKIALC